ncbi:MAG: hypothetical protein LKJ21_03995 [Oscillospiraceae bacterium]|jgi:hypothetical protein|nr:hypothetical protein [Oscillospiraceae bacterium]MCI1991398.1 hypothetical protein [Oscillospiraceae bacterium]MCI2036253.1 hypothetical protein [Oscillospiraceae bacterium]
MNQQEAGYQPVCETCGGPYAQPAGGYMPQQAETAFPAGQNTAGAAQSPMPAQQMQNPVPAQQTQETPPGSFLPITDMTQPQAVTTQSMEYLNGYLRTLIGSRIRVEFLIGTNTYLDRSGTLVAVGANYIVLQESMSDDLLICDFFNIKFITILR